MKAISFKNKVLNYLQAQPDGIYIDAAIVASMEVAAINMVNTLFTITNNAVKAFDVDIRTDLIEGQRRYSYPRDGVSNVDGVLLWDAGEGEFVKLNPLRDFIDSSEESVQKIAAAKGPFYNIRGNEIFIGTDSAIEGRVGGLIVSAKVYPDAITTEELNMDVDIFSLPDKEGEYNKRVPTSMHGLWAKLTANDLKQTPPAPIEDREIDTEYQSISRILGDQTENRGVINHTINS